MKIIIILSVVIVALTACKNENLPESDSVEMNYEEKIKETPKVVVREVTVGEAVTKIIDTGINRVSNITLAVDSISGTELKQGEEFSFNKTVGKRSKDRGYKDAPIIFHGEKSYGIGGGVCQVSTTVYMAALNGGMNITERHKHSEGVAYAPGTDATVVYGEKDLKFKNTLSDTVYIYAWIQDEKVYVKLIRKEMVTEE